MKYTRQKLTLDLTYMREDIYDWYHECV